MENNDEKVNDIINYFKKMLSENKNLHFSKNDIYAYLTNYNISENNNSDIKEFINFDTKKYSNIQYINDDNNLFINKKKNIKCTNPIKIYIPTNYQYIEKTINKILNFFNKKNMAFEMKVTNNICNNDIAIRLSSMEDVNKFLIFIKNSKKIREGLIETNPFCYNEKDLSFTIDGNLSYISVISDYIYKYLDYKKDSIDDINTDDFYNFIIDTYTNTFVNFSKYTDLKIPGIDNPNEEEIFNYKKITELILKVSEKKFTKESFEEHFNECNDIKRIREEKNTFLTLNTLINYISVEKQYKSDNEILETLKKYLETNNLSYITNTGFFRTTMYLTNFRSNIEKILNSCNLSLEELINNLNIKPYKKLDDETIDKLLNQNKDLYKNVLNEESIKLYLATNDYTLLSRKDNLRNNIVNAHLRNNLLNILFSKNISLKEFIETYKNMIPDEITNQNEIETDLDNNINEEKIELDDNTDEETIEEKEVVPEKVNEDNITEENIENNNDNIDEETIFYNSIMDTYNKYQTLYEENKVECDGFTLLNYALTNVIKNNDFSSFTRDNDSRKNIANLGTNKIFKFICNKLEYDNIDITNIKEDELKHIITDYLNNILFDNNEKRKGL